MWRAKMMIQSREAEMPHHDYGITFMCLCIVISVNIALSIYMSVYVTVYT